MLTPGTSECCLDHMLSDPRPKARESALSPMESTLTHNGGSAILKQHLGLEDQTVSKILKKTEAGLLTVHKGVSDMGEGPSRRAAQPPGPKLQGTAP